MSIIRPILLVDDDPNDLELALAVLHEAGQAGAVVTLSNGGEALDYLRVRGRYAGRAPGLPALVILDVLMPHVHGLEVLRQIRSDPDLYRLPVILTTGVSDPADASALYESAHTAFLIKPFTAGALLATSFRVGCPLHSGVPPETRHLVSNPTYS